MFKLPSTTYLTTLMHRRFISTHLYNKSKGHPRQKLLLLSADLVWKRKVNNLVIKSKFLILKLKYRVLFLLYPLLREPTIIVGEILCLILLFQRFPNSFWGLKILLHQIHHRILLPTKYLNFCHSGA